MADTIEDSASRSLYLCFRYQFLFAPTVFTPNIEGVFSYWSEAMQEYERSITVINQGLPTKAALKVIRLPTSWYGVVWENRERYATFSQDRTDLNGGHEHMTDDEFLNRVQLVASFMRGIDFLFDAVVPQATKKRRAKQ
ncbi:hypothetical protein [Sinorhizobium medicae]|uniref:hypothetical protein n=1 Tax=Sinorhizobium medicae TaxID=110321 RepID=UPI000FD9C5A8|nr:hypothetical protein [Sinorhizobium medicae]